MAFLFLYVDDIVLTASSSYKFSPVNYISSSPRILMTNMVLLHHFLGVTVECRDDGLFLSKRQ